jgi:hypothetical protein|tara:strand:- start:72 stop:587 length:516 start_codon:yes stop_codon:yes gene_type:complete
MHIIKHFNKKFEKDYFFIQGIVDIDENYFIEKIKNNFSKELSNTTNIRGQMTDWKTFNKDPKFLQLCFKFMDYLDDNHKLNNYRLEDSWGYKIGFREKTTNHCHSGNIAAGVLYLNNHPQTLDFHEINQKIKPEKGAFALFSPVLQHECKINISPDPKWGIAFNFKENRTW